MSFPSRACASGDCQWPIGSANSHYALGQVVTRVLQASIVEDVHLHGWQQMRRGEGAGWNEQHLEWASRSGFHDGLPAVRATATVEIGRQATILPELDAVSILQHDISRAKDRHVGEGLAGERLADRTMADEPGSRNLPRLERAGSAVAGSVQRQFQINSHVARLLGD